MNHYTDPFIRQADRKTARANCFADKSVIHTPSGVHLSSSGFNCSSALTSTQ